VKSYKTIAILSCLFITSIATFAQAGGGSAAPSTPPTIASVLDRSLSGIERNVMNAAEAVPENKYDFSPATANIPGDFKTPNPVRTTGEQFKHIGDALESYASAILGEKRAETSEENGPKNVKTKQDVINYLKSAFTQAHSAIKTIDQQNVAEPVGTGKPTRLALAVGMVGHTNNHYGQIIEYLRMNGMVPPESQPRK
jgi:uncharacterized damage-inducible protein DinB